MVLQYWELTYSVGDLTATALILEETIVTTTMYFGLLLLAQSRKQLGQVITAMREDIADDAIFENDEEKYLYFSYNIISQRIGKSVAFLSTFVSILLYLNPAIQLLSSFIQGNFSNPYELPYRSYVMFDYRNPELYTLVYILQFPIMYVPIYHGGEVGMIVNMVLHLCAKLSVLSHRIRNIQPRHFNDDIKKVVIEHLKLTKYVHTCSHKIFVFFSILFTATAGNCMLDIRRRSKRNNGNAVDIISLVMWQCESSIRVYIAKVLYRLSDTLNDSFHLILLLELVGRSLRMGITLYAVMIKISTEPMLAYNFLGHTALVVSYLFLYSYIGEQVMYESQKVGDAFYNINWPEVNCNDRKALLTCIVNGQKTMYITAGKFYVFSLFGFTGIMKTSMAGFSMLRAGL
ncbi:uncharacterized protein LOC143348422 [Colletes latitarsis]|uniref:uncharacterized protein LOC143348422 n=1 Tax=Colletes latitarsis TaxID=2605962 RepID=UPI0040373C91